MQTFVHRNHCSCAGAGCPVRWQVILLYLFMAAACGLKGQTPAPTASVAPVATPSPVASPAASATPLPVDPALYLPQATIQLSANAGSNANRTAPVAKRRAQTNAAANLAPSLQVLEVCAPDVFSLTSLPVGSGPVTATLIYNPACADLKVTLAPLDGGQLNGSTGPKQLAVGADGKVTFTYQPPASAGYYNVVAALGGYQRTLPFQVTAASGN